MSVRYYLLFDGLSLLAAMTMASSRATYLIPVKVRIAETIGNTALMVNIISGSLLKKSTARYIWKPSAISALRLQILIWNILFLKDESATTASTDVTRRKILVGVYSQKEMASPSVNLIRFVKNIEMFNPAAMARNRDCILKNIIF
jgi:hypothetical protein